MDSVDSWLGLDFWKVVLRDTVQWAIHTAPQLLLLALATLIALRLVRAGTGRVQSRLLKHFEAEGESSAAEREKRVNTLVGIANGVLLILVWTMSLMLILAELGVDIGPLIAGAGVIGLAIGFGAQELVRDVISGFFLLLENHIRAGDVAIINNTGGVVEHIGLRTIRMRDLSGVVHVVQNGKIDTLANMTKEWSAMVFDIGVAYKEDTDRVSEIMEQTAAELRDDPVFGPKTLEPLEIFGVDSFGDSAVVIKARLKTVPIEQWSVGREYRRRLKHAFDKASIEIPFPHRTLYWGAASPPMQLGSSDSKAP